MAAIRFVSHFVVGWDLAGGVDAYVLLLTARHLFDVSDCYALSICWVGLLTVCCWHLLFLKIFSLPFTRITM